ncbi:GNAT family N-acetyltransferase [Micromonospora tarensis]|uniref:GNAT family N-acetyltransferase n=1 Tax=Micromonospora tarensis TaxID=2806100 RepID=A0ABS1YBQ9_9ACTN|nr:GNAT family N-acetyltransferase [Micromonospora tarensis]MBM0274800.1 GNAT family N-acetyltransferase [Micromonospora tarensis]
MRVVDLNANLADDVRNLMSLGAPYVKCRTPSDYWLYAKLFSSTCPIAVVGDDTVVGAVIAMQGQVDRSEIYVQDVMVHPDRRRRGVAAALISAVREQAQRWGCRRIYLTSEPDNAPALHAWRSLGFINLVGDCVVNGVEVTKDFKGPGKDRAVFEMILR